MQAKAWEERAFMAVSQGEHRLSGLRVDVGQDHPGDAGFDGSGYSEVLFACEGFVIKMGMRVYEIHINANLSIFLLNSAHFS
jgi:hypothetical protein